MTQKEFLNQLYEKYGLSGEDVFKHPSFGYTILTRSGIEKIQAGEKIDVTYDVISCELTNVIIKATAKKDDRLIESFGEASPKNTRQTYPVAIAEKRAMARAVLKMTGAYAYGIKYEEEADEWKDERKELTAQVINRANNAILKAEQTADQVIDALESQGYIVGETHKYGWRKLKPKS